MEYQSKERVCVRCIMDTTDPDIRFNEEGVCNHCTEFDFHSSQYKNNTAYLEELIERIKAKGKHRPYDCMMALSGGTDSSYLLHRLSSFGLKVLVMHYDSGWNATEAIENIKALTDKMNFDLVTYKVDANEFKEIQKAYLRAGVIDLDVPTDHALQGSMYAVAVKYKIPFIITGHNIQTESVMPDQWVTDKLDSINLKDIYRKFGKGEKLKTFPLQTMWTKFRNYNIRKIEMIFLLDYMSYNKEEASEELKEMYGWQAVRVKHGESIWTRFYQCHILPTRFGVDKRKAHYSNLILSGVMSREEATEKLSDEIYKDNLEKDRAQIFERYEIEPKEFERWMNQEIRKHSDFKSEKKIKKFYNRLGAVPLLSRFLKSSAKH